MLACQGCRAQEIVSFSYNLVRGGTVSNSYRRHGRRSTWE